MPDISTPDDLRNWRLSDSDAPVLVIPYDKHNRPRTPMLHREDCRTSPDPSHPRLPDRATVGFDIVERLWLAELTHRAAGHPSTVDFCEQCMRERVD